MAFGSSDFWIFAAKQKRQSFIFGDVLTRKGTNIERTKRENNQYYNIFIFFFLLLLMLFLLLLFCTIATTHLGVVWLRLVFSKFSLSLCLLLFNAENKSNPFGVGRWWRWWSCLPYNRFIVCLITCIVNLVSNRTNKTRWTRMVTKHEKKKIT